MSEFKHGLRVYSRIPSRRALVTAFGADKGNALRRLLDGRTDPESIPATAAWIAQCYNRPRVSELIEHACNVVLEGYGTEAIRATGQWDSYYGDIVAGYVNLGDTYITTLLFDYDRNAAYVCSWGDWVETSERTRRYRFE